MDLATLGIVIKSEGVVKATAELEKLQVTGEKASKSIVDNIPKAWRESEASFKSAAQAIKTELAPALNNSKAAVKAFGVETHKLAPDMLKAATSFKYVGKEFADIKRSSATAAIALGGQAGVAPAMAKAGMSAKQLAFATRGLPAQFTDIFTSLQGGQRPLSVLIQQATLHPGRAPRVVLD